MQSRFPFRATTPDDEPVVRQRITDALTEIADMVRCQARRAAPRLNQDDLEDAIQETMIVLATRSLPAYDAARDTRVSTYVFVCARRAIIDALRKLNTYRASQELQEEAHPAPDHTADAAIEELADAIRADPSAYLPHGQAAVVKHILAGHSVTATARALGISPRTVHTHLRRARILLSQTIETSELVTC